MSHFFLFLLSCTSSSPQESAVDIGELPPLPPRAGADIPPASDPQPLRALRVALVGEVRGEVTPCGCPTLPYGGFVRRERLLDELRADPSPLFLLDAGDTLLKGFSSRRSAQSVRAAAILEMSAMVGVDAWAPGPSDLQVLGVDGVQGSQLTAISATWASPDGQLLLPPSVVLERQGVRLGIVGLSAQPSDPSLREQLSFVDPVEAARAAAAGFPADLDLVVALGSINDTDAARVAREVPALSAVLTTQGGGYDEPASPTPDSATLIETPDRGRYLSVLHLQLGTDAQAPLRMLPDAQRWRERLTLQEQARALGAPAVQQALSAAEAQFTELGTGRNLAHLDTIPLSEAYDGPAAVSSRVAALEDELITIATGIADEEPTPFEPGYASSGACINCHTQEFARWSFTDHAQSAWLSLVGREATENPECISCHTTGFGEVGGFGEPTGANLRKFKAVQCEACHGPLRGHPEEASVHARPVSEASCVGCHDAANSPDFDYETYLPRATCQPPSE